MRSADAIETFLRDEEHELRCFHEDLLLSARAARPLRNYRLAALKLVWYAFTRRLVWPLTGNAFGLYLVKMHKERNNTGAPTIAKNAKSLLWVPPGVTPGVCVRWGFSFRRSSLLEAKKSAFESQNEDIYGNAMSSKRT